LLAIIPLAAFDLRELLEQLPSAAVQEAGGRRANWSVWIARISPARRHNLGRGDPGILAAKIG
jgi:hypothetical protein